MKFFTGVVCALIAAAGAKPAWADAYGREAGFRLLVQQVQGQGQGQARRRGAEQPMPRRDANAERENDRGRMSQEERRQLRRDIRDAGRDIYRPAREAPTQRRRDRRR